MPQLEFIWTFEQEPRSPGAQEEGSVAILHDDLTIALTPQSTHTLACLEELGLPGEGYQLFDRGN